MWVRRMGTWSNGYAGTRPRGLLIEPDALQQTVIAACIRFVGCEVTHVDTLQAALTHLDQKQVDLILWRVQARDAEARRRALSAIRMRSSAHLIVIDDDSEAAQVDLESGADQWLPEQFVPGPVVGAVRAALRKDASSPGAITDRVELRGIVLDGARRALTFGGITALLTRQEWDLLSILISHPNRFLGANEIVRLGWRAGDHETEQVRTYVRRLRIKVMPLQLPCELLSEHGRGYCLSFG